MTLGTTIHYAEYSTSLTSYTHSADKRRELLQEAAVRPLELTGL